MGPSPGRPAGPSPQSWRRCWPAPGAGGAGRCVRRRAPSVILAEAIIDAYSLDDDEAEMLLAEAVDAGR
jgi:hypothetical protein